MEMLARGMERIRDTCEIRGRDSKQIGLRCMLNAPVGAPGSIDLKALLDQIPALVGVGATVIQLPSLPSLVHRIEEVGPLLTEVIGHVENISSSQ
jgi:hypothetical protein